MQRKSRRIQTSSTPIPGTSHHGSKLDKMEDEIKFDKIGNGIINVSVDISTDVSNILSDWEIPKILKKKGGKLFKQLMTKTQD